MLPHATVHPHAGGHIDLIANAADQGFIEMFREKPPVRKTAMSTRHHH